MSISREDVKQLALLARLVLTPDELDAMTTQLSNIVGYVEQLDELDTSQVEPMAHAIEVQNVLADDVPQPSLPREKVLANAPKKDGECYLVPAVLGD